MVRVEVTISLMATLREAEYAAAVGSDLSLFEETCTALFDPQGMVVGSIDQLYSMNRTVSVQEFKYVSLHEALTAALSPHLVGRSNHTRYNVQRDSHIGFVRYKPGSSGRTPSRLPSH